MKELFLYLNPQQRAAVEYIDGPMVVFAGAGTGKTRVITYRIAYLLSLGVSPYNILAVTFTNKAAKEMKERVCQIVPHKGGDVWISTFHSFCAKFLYKEARRIDIDTNFVIYDESDSIKLIKECIKELSLTDTNLSPYEIYEAISKAKDNLIDSESYRINTFITKHPNREIISEIYLKYQNKLSQYNAFDFGDLLMKTIEILKDPQYSEVKEKYCDRFHYIHVDEYQDVNYAQVVLLKILSSKHKNICVVGDDDQAIYSWRGSSVDYLLNFKNDFSYNGATVKEFKIEQNYRSKQSILEVANVLISHNKNREKKKLFSNTNGNLEEDVIIKQLSNEYEEAKFVAEEIIKVIKEKKLKKIPSIAVIYRTNAQSRIFEEVLKEYKIPYRIFGSIAFYERQEIKDIIAYLKVLINPKDTISLKRIINIPPRNIGDTTILYLETLAKEKNISLWEQIIKIDETELSLRTKNSIWKFLTIYDMLKNAKDAMYPSEFIKYLIEKVGYVKMIEESDKFENKFDKIRNIEELVNVAKSYESQEGITTVEEFLNKISLNTAADTEINSDIYNEEFNDLVVTLSTIHAVKGLEFDIVFIVGLEESVLPIYKAINNFSYNRIFYKEYIDKSDKNTSNIEEERRLLYVGITRAKKILYLTHSFNKFIWGIRRECIPSRFLEEILKIYKNSNKNKIKGVDNLNIQKVEKIDYLKIGEFVIHEKFGLGKVVDILRESPNDKVVVLFQDGQQRKLSIQYAKLSKLQRGEYDKNN